MYKIEDAYLINELRKGRIINIALLSHNANWYEIMRLDKNFENCGVAVAGGSTAYVNEQKLSEFQNCDLIILDSTKNYDEREMNELKNIAIEISNKSLKRVTVGYLYYIPTEEKTNDDLFQQVKIVIFEDGREIIEEVAIEDPITTYELIEFTLNIADNYEINKQHLLTKKL